MIPKGFCVAHHRHGQCKDRASCPYSHEPLPPSNDSAKSSPRGSSSRASSPAERAWSPAPSGNSFRGEGKGKPCRFWMKGTCRNGDECTWKHVPDCSFFKKGAASCTKGEACSFRHHDPSKGGAPSSPGNTPRANDGHGRGRSPTPKQAAVCLKSPYVQSSFCMILLTTVSRERWPLRSEKYDSMTWS